jgi:Uma2 family endonuclease
MSSAALKLPSYADLLAELRALPQGTTGEILGEGWLRRMSRPGRKHRSVGATLLLALDGRGLRRGGDWVIEVEAEIDLLGRLLVPDLVGWRLHDGDTTDFLDENPITRTPDWACEILSRSTQQGDRAIKLPLYAAAGVAHVWVIAPETQTIEVYDNTGGKTHLAATARGEQTILLPPFAEAWDLAQLWKP